MKKFILKGLILAILFIFVNEMVFAQPIHAKIHQEFRLIKTNDTCQQVKLVSWFKITDTIYGPKFKGWKTRSGYLGNKTIQTCAYERVDSTFDLIYSRPEGNFWYQTFSRDFREAFSNPGKKIFAVNYTGEIETRKIVTHSHFFLHTEKRVMTFWLRYLPEKGFELGYDETVINKNNWWKLLIIVIIIIVIPIYFAHTNLEENNIEQSFSLFDILMLFILFVIINIGVGVVAGLLYMTQGGTEYISTIPYEQTIFWFSRAIIMTVIALITIKIREKKIQKKIQKAKEKLK